jgi:two-component system response regulator FlrC
MTGPNILVVEDDMDLREALGDTLKIAGYNVALAQDGRMALDALEKQAADKHGFAMVITDIQMPKMDGHTLLKHIKKRWPEIPVLLMTAFGTIQKAVEAIRDGALDYLTKPFEAEVLVNTVSQYVSMDCEEPGSHAFIAADEMTQKLAEVARRVAVSDATVLINGESGSGKEVLARYIHKQSNRADKPFIAINCAAIPDNMLEATLFGYEKGAFTGAYKACPGKFELADGGTLLLDEISEMDLGLQAKLLRVLQEKEVERLGGHNLIQLDVRILATSNRNMKEEVSQGNFREDLFYRLNVFPLLVPPLRDRPRDIVAIAEKLLEKHYNANSANALSFPTLSEEARQKLMSHFWPGNVRELDNVIQRALILRANNEIEAADLLFEQFDYQTAESDQIDFDCSVENSSLGAEVQNHEHKKILQALRETMGNRKAVAEKLGISQRTLRYKLARMREKGIDIPDRYGAVGS